MSSNSASDPGSVAIRQVIEASETASNDWASFYKKVQMITSNAVIDMPGHHIKIIRKKPNGYVISIHGPVYNYDHTSSKIW